MNTKALVGGMTLILLGMALPTNAYHSTASGVDPRGGTSYDWTNAIPFLVICESDGPADTRNDLPTPKMGDGGLCAAGLKGAAVPTSAPFGGNATVGPDVTSHILTVGASGATTPTDVAYTIQVGSWTCSTAVGGTGYVNELYAYWDSDVGHVALFNDDPAAPGGSSVSTAGATRATGSLCDGDPATANGPVTL